jgi:hypothetical protein
MFFVICAELVVDVALAFEKSAILLFTAHTVLVLLGKSVPLVTAFTVSCAFISLTFWSTNAAVSGYLNEKSLHSCSLYAHVP